MDESHSKLNKKAWHRRIHTVGFIHIKLKSKQNHNQRTGYLFKVYTDWEKVQGILLVCLYYSIYIWPGVGITPGKKAPLLNAWLRGQQSHYTPSQIYVITMDTDGAPPASPSIFLQSLDICMLCFCQLTAAIFRGLSLGYWSPFGFTCMELEMPGSLYPP